MREQFEKLWMISVVLNFRTEIHWNETGGGYESHDNKDESYCAYLNGALYAFQEQQKRIDEALQEVKGLERFAYEDCIADFEVLQGAVSHAGKRLEKVLRGAQCQ